MLFPGNPEQLVKNKKADTIEVKDKSRLSE